jgi:CheY-like chemotaxis protein
MKTSVRVLLAEDQALIAALVEATLEDEGCEVTTVCSGSDAITALGEHGSSFRVLITDIRMEPGPDGWTVANMAREAHPRIAVVYMTGDSMDDWKARGVQGSVLLSKPFVPDQVLAAIESLLPGSV